MEFLPPPPKILFLPGVFLYVESFHYYSFVSVRSTDFHSSLYAMLNDVHYPYTIRIQIYTRGPIILNNNDNCSAGRLVFARTRRVQIHRAKYVFTRRLAWRTYICFEEQYLSTRREIQTWDY